MTGRADAKANHRAPLRPLHGQIWALVVLVSSLASVFTLWRVAYDREIGAADLKFIGSTEEIASQLKQQMVQYELVARGGASLFATVTRPTPRQWHGYVAGMDIRNRFPAMLGLGFAGYVPQSRLGQLQLDWRESGQGMLQVYPQGVRRHYGPILYLEPRTLSNVEAVGYDMLSEPVRQEAMERALDTGRPVLSGPLNLNQDGRAGRTELLLYLPVYRNGGRPIKPAARQDSMLGWVYVPFRLEQFVAESLDNVDQQLRLSIYDVGSGGEQLVYGSGGSASKPASSADAAAFSHDIHITHHGRHWRLRFESPTLASAAPRLDSLHNTLALGLFASLLMYAIAWTLARTESRAHSIALRLTEDMRRGEIRFRTAMEHSTVGTALVNQQGEIVEANAALGRIAGRSPQTLVGTPLSGLFEDDSGSSYYYSAAMAAAGGVHRTTGRLHREGGQPRHAQLTYSHITGNVGEDIVGLLQVEDVSERLRAEAQVHALNRTLEARVTARTRELSLANQELEAFAYSVSHDLRAPLRAMEGFSRILVERYGNVMDEAGQGYLDRVRKAAIRMGELIEAMLKMSRLSRGAMTVEKVDISRIAAEVLEELGAEEPERTVRWHIAPGLRVDGDAVLLRNLLTNLLGNAWKFTRGRGHAQITLGVNRTHDGDDEYFIRDNGAGFEQQHVDKLFRPFQRLHDQAQFAGHGIGLASVRRVVERHGGTIRAEGREGEGATFHFTLPDSSDLPVLPGDPPAA